MKIKTMLPASPVTSAIYLTDHLIAFLPAVIFAALFYSSTVITNIILTIACAVICELALSFFLKKALDMTIIVRVLIFCLCMPSFLPKEIYPLGGVLLFILSTLRGFINKYATYECVTLCVLILLIFNPVKTPSTLVLQGIALNDFSVLDLILGTKSDFFMGGCLICVLFAFIYLSLRKRISFLRGVLFYATLVCIVGFMYKDGDMSAIYYVSFIALDPKIFFAALILTSLGGVYPSNKKAGYVLSVIGGVLSGFSMAYLGLHDGIYYVIIIMSLLSCPIEILLCKIGRKKA